MLTRFSVRSCRLCLILIQCCLLLLLGCGGSPEPENVTGIDVSRVPLSPQLRDAVTVARTSLAAPIRTDPVPEMLAEYFRLTVEIYADQTRQQAGDELYATWRDDPENFLWITLAATKHYLLRRKDDRNAVYALPALADTNSAVGNFVRGRRFYGYYSNGEYFRLAEERIHELSPLQQVWLHRMLAMVERNDGDGIGAAERQVRNLAQAREVGGCRLEMILWYDIAESLLRADRLNDALHAMVLAVEMGHKVACEFWVVQSQLLLVEILEARQEDEIAAAMLDECVRVSYEREFSFLHNLALQWVAAIQYEQRQYEEDIATRRRMLGYCLATGDSLNAPRVMCNIATNFLYLEQPESCRAYLARARDLIAKAPNKRNRQKLPQYEAEYYCYIGDYARTDSLLDLAYSHRTNFRSVNEAALLLLNILGKGLEMDRIEMSYRALGRLDEIRDRLYDDQPQHNLLADLEITCADFLAGQGEFQLAAEALERAAGQLRDDKEIVRLWNYHRSRGELALLRHDPIAARAAFTTCLELAREGAESSLLARSRFLLGHALLEDECFDEIRDLFAEQDREAVFGSPFRAFIAALLFRGIALSRIGDHEQALVYFARADSSLQTRPPPDLLARLDIEMGHSLAAMGRGTAAEFRFRRALETLRRAGDGIRVSELQHRNLGSFKDATVALIGLYHDATELCAPTPVAEACLFLAENLYQRNSTRTIHLDQLHFRQQLDHADLPGPCLAFLVGKERSFRWLLSGAEVVLVELPSARELQDRIVPVLADMARPERTIDLEAAADLSRLLLAGIDEVWQHGQTLTIIPDDLLHAVPWSALPWPTQPVYAAAAILLEQGPLVLAPAIMGCQSPTTVSLPTARPLLAIGVNGEPGAKDDAVPLAVLHQAEEEASEIAAFWPPAGAEVRLGAAATWSNIADEELGRYGVIHIASHAVVHQGRPDRSVLRLATESDASPLTVATIAELDLNSDLVYLSCCQAAREISAGGSAGIAGFAHAFLQAGARSVIAPTIRVDDAAARSLATNFYRQWNTGQTRASALQAAKLKVRATAQWQHPFYWAFYNIVEDGPVYTGPSG
ncbi:MAG: CHAT domain-containing protein [bacterium]